VTGYIAGAVVKVIANGVEQVGIDNDPRFPEDDITLTRPLRLTDSIRATQSLLGFTSSPSVDPVSPSQYPPLNKPVVNPILYACGQDVPVDQLNPGTHVSVFDKNNPNPIGQRDATLPRQGVVTSPIAELDSVTAVQTACPDFPTKRVISQTSDGVTVVADPSLIPLVHVESYVVGEDAITMDDLLVGAEVLISDTVANKQIGDCLANDSRNWCGVNPPVQPATRISVVQKLCTSSNPSPPQPPSASLPQPTIIPPVCAGTPSVTVRDTVINSIVVVFRNGQIATMAGGIPGDNQITLGGGATWTLGDEIRAVQYVGNVISPSSSSVFVDCAPQNVLTQHNDNSRSGAYLVESRLTPANVNPTTFGRLYTRTVDGDIVGQPLYVRAVRTASAGVKNLIFVTTSKNNVYAFDADNLDPNPAHGLVWQINLCSSVPSSVCSETWSRLVGITSTPVIDPNTNTMYVVTRCSDGTGGANDGAIFIHAINIADGTERVTPPVQIDATDPANPNTKFDFHCQRNRPGLLLSNGVVYAAFGTFSCDQACAPGAPYRGWVLGYRASDLKQVAVFDASPQAGGVGIWQTGNGLAATADGSIYLQTGNGPTSESLQDSFVKLQPSASPPGLVAAGSFTPNDAATLSNGDTDLGSGGPMLLPHGRLIGGGKQGRYYVLDQGGMTLTQDAAPDALGFNGFQAFINTYHNDNAKPSCPPAGGAAGCDPTASSHSCYIDPSRYQIGELCGPNIHGGPIFWQPNTSYGLIYEMPEKDFLKAFKYDLTTNNVGEMPLMQATGTLARPTDGMPGGFSSVSANQMNAGIIWTSMPFGDGQWNPVPGRLVAFDASNLKQLWSDDDNVLWAKSVPPTIADGKVVRATAANQVIVYGLLNVGGSSRLIRSPRPQPRAALCDSIEQKYANYGAEIGLLGSPTGPERTTDDRVGGRYRDYRGSVFGMSSTILSQMERAGAPLPTCSVPVGESVTVDSSIYWSPKTCAHVVQGQIRDLWLQLGGVKSRLGYPTGDETLTPDQLGRRSSFEHGDIWWYPEKGAYLHTEKQR